MFGGLSTIQDRRSEPQKNGASNRGLGIEWEHRTSCRAERALRRCRRCLPTQAFRTANECPVTSGEMRCEALWVLILREMQHLHRHSLAFEKLPGAMLQVRQLANQDDSRSLEPQRPIKRDPAGTGMAPAGSSESPIVPRLYLNRIAFLTN